MVLVDERFLEHLYRKQDSNWRKPADQIAKSKLNRQMKIDLDDSTSPDDLTVKKYNQDLMKFLNTKRKMIEETPAVSEYAKDEQIEKLHGQSDIKSAAEKKKRKNKKVYAPLTHISRPKRVRKIPKKFAWDEW